MVHAQEDKSFLQVHNLRKAYGHIQALNGVSFSAACGEILAIVGDNGAGKSTLIKILSGDICPDAGSIRLDNKEYRKMNPRLAHQCGIATVYQDLSLVNTLNVWENIFLGHEHRKLGFLAAKKMRQEAEELLIRLQINIPDTNLPVSFLSGGQRQAVSIAKAIHQGGRLIIFDEPTAAMGIKETKSIQKIMQNLASQNCAVLIISHNIQQVFQISQRICVLGHGQVLASVKTAKTPAEEIVSMIVNGSGICV